MKGLHSMFKREVWVTQINDVMLSLHSSTLCTEHRTHTHVLTSLLCSEDNKKDWKIKLLSYLHYYYVWVLAAVGGTRSFDPPPPPFP
jgi:hypothetical protein